jgi:uncharacterized protein YdcH (DUF465 family)
MDENTAQLSPLEDRLLARLLEKSNGNGNGNGNRSWMGGNGRFWLGLVQIVLAVFVGTFSAFVAFESRMSSITHKYSELDKRISIIENNRFTSNDAQELKGQVTELAIQIAALPSEYPPQWFANIVNGHAKTLETMERRIDRVERKLDIE